MKAVQGQFDARSSVGPLRSKLRRSSFELLLEYLAKPDLERWKQAVFTDLLRVFDQSRMADSRFGDRFRDAAEECLPLQAVDSIDELDDPRYVAGRGAWLRPDSRFAHLYVALSQPAITNGDLSQVFAAVRLDDRDPDPEGYKGIWNGTLRLYNLLQFLPNAWWTTTRGVDLGGYPEFAPPREAPPDFRPEWKEALDEIDDGLRDMLADLSGSGVEPPEVGFELVGASGAVVAEAEVAWPDCKVAVLMADQEEHKVPFESAGWMVFGDQAPADAIRAALQPTTAKEV